MKTIFLNIGLGAILLLVLFVHPGFAQGPRQAPLTLPKFNITLKPQIKCVNFSKEDYPVATEIAQRFNRFFQAKFDSVSRLNNLFYTIDPTKKSDFQFEAILDHFGQSFATLRITLVDQATQNPLTNYSSSLGKKNDFDQRQFQNIANLMSSLFFSHINTSITVTDRVINPDNKQRFPQQQPLIIPSYFTAEQPQLQALAKKMTHIANNTITQMQTLKIQKVWQTKEHRVYEFNYYPNYRLSSKVAYTPQPGNHVITGTLSQKDDQHLVLTLDLKGEDLQTKLYDSSVKQDIVFSKDLIDRGIYSEMVHKIQQNFSLLVLSNYR